MADLSGGIGQIGRNALATDGDYLVWQENLGDIWAMDVVYWRLPPPLVTP